MEYRVEDAILSILWHDTERIVSDINDVNEDMFFYDTHKSIYRKLKKCIEEGKKVDSITALDLGFKREEILLVNQVMSNIGTIYSYDSYLETLKENHKKAQLRDLVISENYTFDEIQDILNDTTQKIKIHSTGDMNEYIEYRETLTRGDVKMFDLGFPTITKQVGKLRPQRLFTIGARTNRGKTSFALQIAYNLAKQKHKVIYLTSEMPETELRDKLICQLGDIEVLHITEPKLMTAEELKSEIPAQQKMYDAPFDILEMTRFKVSNIRKLMNTKKYDVLIADHLQRFSVRNDKNRNEASEISEICNTLKDIAIDFNCLVILLSQIDRTKEAEEEHLILSNLKGSGGIEESADLIMFIESRKRLSNKCYEDNLNFAKHRFGTPCHIPIYCEGLYGKFIEKI